MSNVRNIARAATSTIGAATSTVAVSGELVADGAELVQTTVKATPAILKALLQLPFAAGVGYLMEAEGLTEAEAHIVAYHYVNQPVAKTIEEAGQAAGKLVAKMAEDLDDEDVD